MGDRARIPLARARKVVDGIACVRKTCKSILIHFVDTVMQKTICAGEGDRTLDLRIAPECSWVAPEFSGEVTVGMNRRVD